MPHPFPDRLSRLNIPHLGTKVTAAGDDLFAIGTEFTSLNLVVVFQAMQHLPGLNVPEPCRMVVRSGGQHRVVRRKTDVVDIATVVQEMMHDRSRIDVDKLNLSIARSHRKRPAVVA